MQFRLWLENAPVIVAKRNEYDAPPHLDIYFPATKTRWRYTFPDQFTLNDYLHRYGRNKGRLVANIKMDKRITAAKLT